MLQTIPCFFITLLAAATLHAKPELGPEPPEPGLEESSVTSITDLYQGVQLYLAPDAGFLYGKEDETAFLTADQKERDARKGQGTEEKGRASEK